jgi:hypothetical protein
METEWNPWKNGTGNSSLDEIDFSSFLFKKTSEIGSERQILPGPAFCQNEASTDVRRPI